MGPAIISIPGVEVLEEQGRGAFGAVYRVRRGGRYYALKIPIHPRAGAPDDQLADRVLREAVALARVRHPALPSVMEVGRLGRTPYIIMELAAGETLAERLRDGPLDESQALELGIQLADALSRVHESGLIHRDIRAENILFDSHTTAVRLVDFGFASALGPPSDDDAESDKPGGSELPNHVARLPDERADLFSLGAVLFECVTGVKPFVAVDPGPLLERSGDTHPLPPRISRGFAQALRRLLCLPGEAGYRDGLALCRDLTELGTASRRAGMPVPVFGRSVVPLLGRERELDRIRTAFRASAAGRSQIVLVRGGAGSGKTRLLRGFLEELAIDGRRFFSVGCHETAREPFGVVKRLIESRLDEHERLAPGERLERVAAFRALAGDAAPLLRVLSPRLARVFPDAAALPHWEGAEQIFAEGLAEFMRKLFGDGEPIAVAIDDVQWLDPGSRRVLGRLSDRASARVLYLLAARDDTASWKTVERLVRALDPERVWELPLDLLDAAQVMDLVRAYLGQERLDPELAHFIAGLNNGTPLGVLEIVRSMLDGGALTPHWGEWRFDAAAAGSMGLPRGSIELVRRRIATLDPAAVGALSAAAVIGSAFEVELLSRVCGLSADGAEAALSTARRALLVEGASVSGYRFVHDSVREALLAGLGEASRRSLHQRIAEALDPEPNGDALALAEPGGEQRYAASVLFSLDDERTAAAEPHSLRTELAYRLAAHYADGECEKAPRRTLSACLTAGKLAFQSFDNELALRFFEVAAAAARALGEAPDVGLELLSAEALLRNGALDAGLTRLRFVVELSDDAVTRAFALSRMAWAEMQLDTERAWVTLRRAFVALGVEPPGDSLGRLALSVLGRLKHVVLPSRAPANAAERHRLEVLCALFYQEGRLAFHTEKPLRLIQAALRGLAPARRLGPSSALSRSYLHYSFVLTALGFRQRGARYLRAAEELALSLGNPMAYAHALQVHITIAAYGGDIPEALRVGARSMDEYGHWRELGEFCITANNQQLIEGVRGRNLEAWKWMERAIAKLSKHEGPPMALEFFEQAARAALTALGRERESEMLMARLVNITTRPPANGAVLIGSWGSRVRKFTECGRLDAGFENLVAEFAAQRFDPRRVALATTEYYVHVAHARVHACLNAKPEELKACRARLDEAHRDLALGARLPLLVAHATVIDAYRDYFAGQSERAERSFGKAETLGRAQAAPLVLYAVHRGRAHMLRAEGRMEAAIDEARLAEALAREHGAAYRLRWIREEFGLRGRELEAGTDSASGSSDPPEQRAPDGASLAPLSRPRPRGYLRSLVRIGQRTAKELELGQQVRVVLDELVGALRADRGYLFLTRARMVEEREHGATGLGIADEAEPPSSRGRFALVAARTAGGAELAAGSGFDPRLVEDLMLLGTFESGDDTPSEGSGVVAVFGDRSVVATALSVRGGRIGVVYLDRPLRAGPFGERDARGLASLANQVPLVFELARSLRARERVEETQRSAEKLEAIGRLAGGIAHDFNNMLSVILAASEQVLSGRSARDPVEDVKTIQSAAERARDLTRQLLAFSRGQYLNPEVLELNDSIERLEPIFRRLLGDRTSLELELDPELCRVKADPAQIDQVLTNLVVNAGDAMRERGGRLLIQTSNVSITKPRAGAASALTPGRYARILVSDTGEGMDPVTVAKAFEPFFTTKQGGSGLGLATAYGIVTQSGGHIEIESQPGAGTTFRIFLPETGQRPSLPVPAQNPERIPHGNETILLVDDEPLVRESTRRMLASIGYSVLTAKNSQEALILANRHLRTIDLVITDVVMPGMNGLELARELSRLSPTLRVLFVSGYTAGVLAERGVLKESVDFLQKPIALDVLAPRLRTLLDPRAG